MDEGDQAVTKHLIAGDSILNSCMQPSGLLRTSSKYLIQTEREYYLGDERKLHPPENSGFLFEGEVNQIPGLNGKSDKLKKEMADISRHIGKIAKLHLILSAKNKERF